MRKYSKQKFNLQNCLQFLIIVLFSTLISYLILNQIFTSAGFTSEGKITVLTSDMKDQYIAFFTHFKKLVKEPGRIFYDLQLGAGNNFFGVFSYYLSSPFNFLILLFDNANIYQGVYIISFIKYLTAGVTLLIMLKGIYKKNSLFFIPLAISYTIMGYNMAYSISIMWFDSIILLPLVILGIVKLIDEKKMALFICSFIALIISNYYTAYMVAIFAVVFFVGYLFNKYKIKDFSKYKDIIIKAAFATIVVLGVTAFFTLPTLEGVSQTNQASGFKGLSAEPLFMFNKLFGQLVGNNMDGFINPLPMIFVGFFATFFGFSFFVRQAIPLKERVISFLILALLALALYIPDLNTFMHAGRIPNWFPHRFAFILSFYLIFLAGRNLSTINFNFKNINLEALTLFLIIPLSCEIKDNGVQTFNAINQKHHYVTKESFDKEYATRQALLSMVEKDEGFSRLIFTETYTTNDPLLFDYNGLAYYVSSFNKNYNDTLKYLGFAQYWFWTGEQGSTPMSDSLLGIKHTITQKNSFPNIYNLIDDYQSPYNNKSYKIYQNDYTLPLWYSANNQFRDIVLSNADHVGNQNNALNLIVGEKVNMFDDYSQDAEIINNTFFSYSIPSVLNDGPLYLKYRPFNNSVVHISVNNRAIGSIGGSDINRNNIAFYLGDFAKGDSINIRFTFASGIPSNPKAFIHGLNSNLYKTQLSNIINDSSSMVNVNNSIYKGSVNVKDDASFIATSIPYAKGLSAKIDGKKAKTFAYMNSTFLGIEAKQGIHKVEITYTSSKFIAGLFISGLTTTIAPLLYLNSSSLIKLYKETFSNKKKYKVNI